MSEKRKALTVLMADDDPDDCMLVKDAFDECGLVCNINFVYDGVELFNYLNQSSPYSDPETSPFPNLILLDLNMPKKDGREALKEIKLNAAFRSIPVVILTTSISDMDIISAYHLGAASYLIKPDSFERLVHLVKCLGHYWFDCVKLPPLFN
jgi:CheY-like chemotaxis protein